MGDKTFVDTLAPFADALEETVNQGADLAAAWHDALRAAESGMASTAGMVARKGRASYLGERSAGHQDPGATSSYLILQAAADTWAGS